MPAVADITQITSGQNNYSPKDGRTGFIGLTLTDGSSYVYQIDATTAKATRGLKIEGGTITAINQLSYK
jgi:hypothetical protein